MSLWTNGICAITTPAPTGRPGLSSVVSVFNILGGAATRPTLVAALDADEKKRFSAPNDYLAQAGYTQMFIKAPGTDFIIPAEFVQFAPAMRKIIDFHYYSGKTNGWNRDGSESCFLLISQKMSEPYQNYPEGALLPHLDMDVDSVVAKGSVDISERYAVSDRLPTVFYEGDLKIPVSEITVRDTPAYWSDRVRKVLEDPAMKQRRFGDYEIVHYDNTTPHATFNPATPVRRTFLTMGFSSGVPDAERINNPYLQSIMQKQMPPVTAASNLKQ